jgi:hypothetical protein
MIMRPLAIALAIATLVAPGLAGAQGYGRHDHGGGHGGHGWAQGGRFDGPPGGGPGFLPGGGPGYGPRGPGYGPRGPIYGPGGPGYDGYGRGGFGPGPARAPYGGGWRRGQYLPPAERGFAVNDYGRYHLRHPPRGYYWSRVGNDFVLAAVGSGLIFDVIGADGY